MTSRQVFMLVYWGGQIINGEHGWGYNMQHKRGIVLKEGTTYSKLVEMIYSAMDVDCSPSTLKILCRCLLFVTTNTCSYFLHEINDDGSLQFAMATIFNAPFVNVVDLYVEKVDLNYDVFPIWENIPLSGLYNSPPSTQCTPGSNLPSSSRSSRRLKFGGSNMKICHSSQPIPEPMYECEDGIEYDDATREDTDWGLESDSLTEFNDTEIDEWEESNQIEQVAEDIPSLYRQFNVTYVDQEVTINEQLVDENELRKGLIYDTKDKLKIAVKQFAIRTSMEFIVDKSKADTWAIRCKLHEKGCKWRLRACKRKKKHGQFEITKYEGFHTCTFDRLKLTHKHLDCKFIASKVKHLVEVDPALKIRVIVAFVKDQYGYKISYWKAWNAKQKAVEILFGNWKESYAIMLRYLAAIKYSNPHMIHECQSKQYDGHYRLFDKNFWAFSASIEGFMHCRPVISIDATHLREKYNGKLFVAMGMDESKGLFPLAFGYGDEESHDTWNYFLTRLWHYVVRGRDGVCLLSDRHRGILFVINSDPQFQEPMTYHRFCMRHVRSNFTNKCKPDGTLRKLMWKAATAYCLPKFNKYMAMIKEYDGHQKCEGKKPWRWLNQIPLEKWTFVHNGGHRYRIASTNISEVFNGVLIGARSLPITASVQLIFHRLVTYFCQRGEEGRNRLDDSELEHTPFMALKLSHLVKDIAKYNVFRQNNSEGVASVTPAKGKVKNVNIQEGTCSCGRWTTYKYPCSHVMAVCGELRLDPKYLIDQYLSLEAYVATFSRTLHPALPKDYWEAYLQTPIAGVLIPNPNLLRQKGRPSRRIHNEMDVSDRRRNNHCGICGEAGHDRRTCPGNKNKQLLPPSN